MRYDGCPVGKFEPFPGSTRYPRAHTWHNRSWTGQFHEIIKTHPCVSHAQICGRTWARAEARKLGRSRAVQFRDVDVVQRKSASRCVYYDERIRCLIALLIAQYDGRACAPRRDLRRRPLRTSCWPFWTHPKASPRPPSRPCRQPATWPSATSCVVKAGWMVFDYFLLGSGRVSIYAESWSRGS